MGELFADGVRKAAEKIGPKSEPFAMDIAGEELPMHDAKLQPEYFATYKLDPTPARHTLYNGRPTDPWGVPAPPTTLSRPAAAARTTREPRSTCTW